MSAVLLVEDNLLLCKLEERYISAAFPDVTLHAVHNGKEALAVAEEEPPDAVVMDCRLPGCGCLELLEGILRISPDAAIIIASADPPKDLMGKSYREKIFGVLEKPFETEELIDVLQRAFRERGRQVSIAASEIAEAGPLEHFNRHATLNTLTGILVLVRSLEEELAAEAEHADTIREIVSEYVPRLIKLVQRATVQVKAGP